MRVVRLVAVSLIILLAGAPLAWGAPPDQAIGYVSRIDGVVSLVRNGASRDLRLGENVFVGDVVRAVPPAMARIDTRSGGVTVCAGSRSPAECQWLATAQKGVAVAPDWWNRSSVLAAWNKSTPANLVTRSVSALKLGIALGAPQQLATGKRSIAIPVNDGSPPFRARLMSGDRSVAEVSAQGQIIRFVDVDLPPGPLDLVVVDRINNELRARFVGASTPTFPDMRPSAVDRDHQLLLEAGWLSIQNGDTWRLEAYQRLDSIAHRNEVAAMLGRALAAGQRP